MLLELLKNKFSWAREVAQWSSTCLAYVMPRMEKKSSYCKKRIFSWAWWYSPVIPALGRGKQKDLEFKTSLGYMVRACPIELSTVIETLYLHCLTL
jgi:hypothetical protein